MAALYATASTTMNGGYHGHPQAPYSQAQPHPQPAHAAPAPQHGQQLQNQQQQQFSKPRPISTPHGVKMNGHHAAQQPGPSQSQSQGNGGGQLSFDGHAANNDAPHVSSSASSVPPSPSKPSYPPAPTPSSARPQQQQQPRGQAGSSSIFAGGGGGGSAAGPSMPNGENGHSQPVSASSSSQQQQQQLGPSTSTIVLPPGAPPSEQRHLFHAYIYDYLFKQGFYEAARAFLIDAPDTAVKRLPAAGGASGAGPEPGPSSATTSSSKGKERASTSPSDAHTASPGQSFHQDSQGDHRSMDTSASQQKQGSSGADAELKNASSSNLTRSGKARTASSDDSSSVSSLFGQSAAGPATSSKDSANTSTTSMNATMNFATSSKTDHDALSDGRSHSPDMAATHTGSLKSPASGPLPHPEVQIKAPIGFLFEWWSVFWDVFRARGNKSGSPAAKAFFQAYEAGSLPTSDGLLTHPLSQQAVFGIFPPHAQPAYHPSLIHHQQQAQLMQSQHPQHQQQHQQMLQHQQRSASMSLPSSGPPGAPKPAHIQPGTSTEMNNKPNSQQNQAQVHQRRISVSPAHTPAPGQQQQQQDGQQANQSNQQPNALQHPQQAGNSAGSPAMGPPPRSDSLMPGQQQHPQPAHLVAQQQEQQRQQMLQQQQQQQMQAQAAQMGQPRAIAPNGSGRRFAIAGPGVPPGAPAQHAVQMAHGQQVYRVVMGPNGQPVRVLANPQHPGQQGAMQAPGQPVYQNQQGFQGQTVQQRMQAQQAHQMQQQGQQGMYPPGAQARAMPPGQGLPPQQQQGQAQQQGMQPQMRARPPSVTGQMHMENGGSPMAMQARAPSRSAAGSPYLQPQQGTPRPEMMQNGHFARPGQPGQMIEEGSSPRKGLSPESQQQLQGVSPHGQMINGQPVMYRQPMPRQMQMQQQPQQQGQQMQAPSYPGQQLYQQQQQQQGGQPGQPQPQPLFRQASFTGQPGANYSSPANNEYNLMNQFGQAQDENGIPQQQPIPNGLTAPSPHQNLENGVQRHTAMNTRSLSQQQQQVPLSVPEEESGSMPPPRRPQNNAPTPASQAPTPQQNGLPQGSPDASQSHTPAPATPKTPTSSLPGTEKAAPRGRKRGATDAGAKETTTKRTRANKANNKAGASAPTPQDVAVPEEPSTAPTPSQAPPLPGHGVAPATLQNGNTGQSTQQPGTIAVPEAPMMAQLGSNGDIMSGFGSQDFSSLNFNFDSLEYGQPTMFAGDTSDINFEDFLNDFTQMS